MNKNRKLGKMAAILMGALALSVTSPALQQEAQAAYGWQYQYGNWYYYNHNQQMEWSTWVWDGSAWYYLDSSGAMYANRWLEDLGTWYYLTGSGAMATGWQWLDGAWYYFHQSGQMHRGWLNDGGTWYYLGSDGAMYANAYTPDGYYVNSSGVWNQSYNSGYNQGSNGNQSTGSLDPDDYEPSWYNWSPTGYSAQDIDLIYVRAGKWVSENGKTVLYTDYSSSPDFVDYGLFYKGKIRVEQSYADIDWNIGNADDQPYMAKDRNENIRFKVPQKGVMDVTVDGNTVRLYLERAKYEEVSYESGDASDLNYENGYMADMMEYAYAFRPWLVLNRDGTFTFSENYDGYMTNCTGTYYVTDESLVLKILEMDYGNEHDMGTPVVSFWITPEGNLMLTTTETNLTPTQTFFYINTRE